MYRFDIILNEISLYKSDRNAPNTYSEPGGKQWQHSIRGWRNFIEFRSYTPLAKSNGQYFNTKITIMHSFNLHDLVDVWILFKWPFLVKIKSMLYINQFCAGV